MKEYGNIDSKFRYVILVSKRAKQLLKGAKPKFKSKTKNLIRLAQEEVDRGLVDFELVKHKVDELHSVEDDIFIGEELIEGKEVEDKPAKLVEAEVEKEDVKPKGKTESKKEKDKTKKEKDKTKKEKDKTKKEEDKTKKEKGKTKKKKE